MGINKLNKQKGFSLLDTIVAIAVLGVGLTIAGSMVSAIYRTHGLARRSAEQNEVAANVADRLAAIGFSGRKIGVVVIRGNQILLDVPLQPGDQVHEYSATSADRGTRKVIAVSVFDRRWKISAEVAAQYQR